MDFPRIRSTFGVTPYNPDRDTEEKRRMIAEHYKDQTSAQPLPDELQPYNVPFPPGQFAQEEFDDMLQRRVVDPLAKAGFEDLGAGLAAVPSAAHSMIVPQTEFDVAGTLIPLPAVAKLMKKGKFRKISKAMHVEDPENAAGIIAKQAGKAEPVELPTGGSYRDVTKETLEQESNLLKKDPLKYHNQKEKEYIEAARKLIDPTSEPIQNGKKVGGPRHPAHEGYRPLPGKEEQFKALLKKAEEHGQEWTKLKEGPKAEVRAIDEKEMLRKEDLRDERRRFKQESDFFDKHGFSEKEIEQQIAKKYGLKGDNHFWSMADDEAESYLGTSDASGKEGYVIDITNGDETISVLQDEYMDIMGLSGAIPIDETPFVQAMKTKKPKIQDKGGDIGERTQRIKESLSKIDKLMEEMKNLQKGEPVKPSPRESPLKVVEPPKGPKGDPEASLPRQPDKFAAIRSQLDVAPSRMDERGKAFGDVGQSEFLPDSRPNVIREDVPRRNYVESDLGRPVSDYPATPVRGHLYAKEPFSAEKIFGYPTARKFQDKMYMKPLDSENKIRARDTQTQMYGGKTFGNLRDADNQAKEIKSFQNEMYKGRPSHAEEQAKLFPKVKEAVKGKAPPKSGPGYTQGRYHVKDWAGNDMPQFGTYDDMEEAIEGVYDHFRKQGLDDEALDEVLEDLTVQERKGWKPSKKVTKEESDRLLEEKLKDWDK